MCFCARTERKTLQTADITEVFPWPADRPRTSRWAAARIAKGLCELRGYCTHTRRAYPAVAWLVEAQCLPRPRLTAVSFMRGCRLYPRVAPTLLQREYSVRLPRGSVVGRGTVPTPRLTAVSSLLIIANRSLFFLSSQTVCPTANLYLHAPVPACRLYSTCAKLSLLSSPSSLGGCSVDRAAAGGRSCLHAYL